MSRKPLEVFLALLALVLTVALVYKFAIVVFACLIGFTVIALIVMALS